MNNAELSNFLAGIAEVNRLIARGDEIVKSIGAGDVIAAIPSDQAIGEAFEERKGRDCKAAPVLTSASAIWEKKLKACRNQEEERLVRGDMWWSNLSVKEKEDYLESCMDDEEDYGRGDEIYKEFLESQEAIRKFKTNAEIGRLDELMLYREAICPFVECVCGLCEGLAKLILIFHG